MSFNPFRRQQIPVPDLTPAERRQGGKAIVLDAKHFTVTPLNRNEVDTTDEYRKRTRASHAVLAVSPVTKVPQSVHDHVERIGRMTICRLTINSRAVWLLSRKIRPSPFA